ncbi:MAG: DoxX family protein [Bacteroidetes bacterium]|nr:DoxX family protein [Bacteroidota bacterium]
MKYILWLIRIIVGALFIFSGVIKAIDPLGLSYKMKEFFEVWGMFWADPYSLPLSIMMIAFEIIAGVAVLLGYAQRVFSVLLLLLITFFTFLTAYVLFSGKIKECGCFGDCVKITNEETFWKDVILLVLGFVLFLFRKKIEPVFNQYVGTVLMVLTVIFSFGIQWSALTHLPLYDCLPYKVGTDMVAGRKIPPGAQPDVYETIMIYEKDGVKKEFTMQNYPWQDTTWVFVDRKDKLIKKGNAEPKLKDYTISDFDGNDVTESVLGQQGYTFLLYVRSVTDIDDANMDKLHVLLEDAEKNNVPFYLLCSSTKEEAEAFRKKNGLDKAIIYTFDGTVARSTVRSNPGLMLIESGVIKGKWAPADYPQNMATATGK